MFVSHTYAVTFRAPPGLTYCRLAEDWTGSDHGTILFLSRPMACEGAGYPSSSRGFTPDTAPRIEIYYGNRLDGEDAPPLPPCHAISVIRFLGRMRPLCRTEDAGMVIVQVTAHYRADSPAEVAAALITTPARLGRDLRVLRALGATAHTCAAPWQDVQNRTRYTGSGHRCPATGGFY